MSPSFVRLITVLSLLLPASAFAQASGTFNGRILDQGDAILPGVIVTATHTATNVTRTTTTNGEGVYSLPGLDSGTYDITAELPGFAPATFSQVNLAVNATMTLDFKLRLAGVLETITVAGGAPLV